MNPPWASEPVLIEPPDPNWRRRSEEECRRVALRLADWGVHEVEHFGSTAVPGLPAKPIIDVMARVPSLATVGEMVGPLFEDGWNHVPPDLDGRDWRMFFVKTTDGRRSGHLHLLEPSSERWHRQLAFRDALRASSKLVEEYAALKFELAARFRTDREAYTEGKTAFIEAVLDERKRSGD